MTKTFEGSAENEAYVYLNLVMALVATLATLTIILLIRKMQIYTGHVKLIYWMSCFQLIYDLTIFFSNVNCGYYVTVVANFFQLSCGIAASITSNWIAFVAFFMITYRKKFNVIKRLNMVLAICFIPGLVDAVIFMVAAVPKQQEDQSLVNIMILYVYYYIRLGSIFLNFIFCGITLYRIRVISSRNMVVKGVAVNRSSMVSLSSTADLNQSHNNNSTNNKNNNSSNNSTIWQQFTNQFKTKFTNDSSTKHMSVQELAIRTLAMRMICYPIVQAVSRSGYAWYEAVYGTDIDEVDSNPNKYIALMFLTLITPFADIGYLVIFLIMQPRAYATLREVFCGPEKVRPSSSNSFAKSVKSARSVKRRKTDTQSQKSYSIHLSIKSSLSRFSFFDWTGDTDDTSDCENANNKNTNYVDESNQDMPFNPSIASSITNSTVSPEEGQLSICSSRSSAESSRDFDKFDDEELLELVEDTPSSEARGTHRRSSLMDFLMGGWKRSTVAESKGVDVAVLEDPETEKVATDLPAISVVHRDTDTAPFQERYSISFDEGRARDGLSIFSTASSVRGSSFVGNENDNEELQNSGASEVTINVLHQDDRSQKSVSDTSQSEIKSTASLKIKSSSNVGKLFYTKETQKSSTNIASNLQFSEDEQL